MAVQQTQALPPQYVEDLQKDFGTQLTAMTATPLNTGLFAPKVAGQDQAQADAYTMATTQGQGIGAFFTLYYTSGSILRTNCLSTFYVSVSTRCN
tara:strand:+ start:1131 stop:1415 length:285 start_codon:yes stop_codon:yes gene_type:complete